MLDTQTLVWLLFDDPRLGQQARLEIDRAWLEDDAAVSAMTFWKIALMHQRRRLTLLGTLAHDARPYFRLGS